MVTPLAHQARGARGVAQGQFLHHLVQRGLGGGSGQPVHMIAHKTIGQQRRMPFIRVLLQERKVPSSILPVEEHLISIIPPLDDMMGESWCNGSGDSRHGRRLAVHRGGGQENGMCPGFSHRVSQFSKYLTPLQPRLREFD